MRKLLCLIAVCAFFTHYVDAKVVSFDQAKAIATQQFANPTKLNASNAQMRLSYQAMNLKGQTDYYVFNRDGGQGYVIVSGDDMMEPVLGYSEVGSFDFNKAPEYLKYLLEEFQNSLEWMRKNPRIQETPSLRYNPDGKKPMFLNDYGEGPHWHQFAPYNNYYPSYNGERCVAGCVPIAFAHIMKGMEYPTYGFGSNTYNYELGGTVKTATANFNHTYKYKSMKNGYTSTSSGWQDCAQMIYDIAVAFNTKFSTESSNASYHHVMKGMVAYFNFHPDVQFTQKKSYSEQNWRDMIYNELDNNRPVFYYGYRTIANSGADTYTGHAFVMDGYDREGRVRVIWGFQPEEYNSWFSFDLLSPRIYGNTPYEHDQVKEGFNTDQGAIIGIDRDTTDRGGIVVKDVELVADTMPASDVRATINLQALSGKYAGTLRYGIVSKTTSNNTTTYSTVYYFTTSVDLADNEIASISLNGAYPYLTEGQTYYIVVWSPFFPNNYDWNWFLGDPVPFIVGDWVTPPDPQYILGDVNNDGHVDIDDITMLIDIVLNGGAFTAAGDMDESGSLDIDDVTRLIDKVLGNN